MDQSYLIALIVAGIIIVWGIGMYNGLIARRNRADESWADIDVQLKRRYDLIPNLMEAVKGYMQHERQTLEAVTNARANALSAQGIAAHAQAENMLSEALKSLFAVAENYPDLKASQNFLKFQDELSDTENKVQAARRFYNTNVRDFNTAIQQFPNTLIAGAFRFSEREFFELTEEAERQPVKVSF